MKLLLILTLSLYFNLTPPEPDRPSGGEFNTGKIHRIVSMSDVGGDLQEPLPMQIEVQQFRRRVVKIDVPEPIEHEPIEMIPLYHEEGYTVDHDYFTLIKAITLDECRPIF